MPVVYHCPHCRQPAHVPDAMLGQAITCPQCRGAFQTFPAQPPTPVPAAQPQAHPLSLDDEPASSGDGFDKLDDAPARGRAGSRYRKQQKGMPLPNLLATIAVVIGSAITMAYNQANRRAGQGFDGKGMLIAGVVGGVCAAIGFGIGKLIEAGNADKQARRGRGDDD